MGRFDGRCLALALVLFPSCQGETLGQRQYVGIVGGDSDGDLSMALATSGPFVALFACGDDPNIAEYPGWITDASYSGHGPIALTRGGWTFAGAEDGDHAAGTLTGPSGTVLQWTGTPVRGRDVEGLYTAYDSGCTTGVIVVGDGRAAKVRGAWCNAQGEVHQVIITAQSPQLVDGQLAVEVPLAAGPRQFDVSPVKLPLRDR